MNSTEWEITIHLQEFDESWIRDASGRGSDIIILNSRFYFIRVINVEFVQKEKIY